MTDIKYYFVSYERAFKDLRFSKEIPPKKHNKILRGQHPLEWVISQRDDSPSQVNTVILFWQEIPEELALSPDIIKSFGITHDNSISYNAELFRYLAQ